MNLKQFAELKTDETGRTIADARTSKTPSSQTTRSPSQVTSADQLVVGMRLQLTDQQVHGLVEVKYVYPKNYKSLDDTEASAYVEGIKSHSWSGLYFDEHLKQYKAVIVQG